MLKMEGEVPNGQKMDITQNTYEMVFKQYYAPLTYYAHTIVKNRDESEDIVQSVFTDLWGQKDKLKIHTSLKSFLYKAVYFKSLNHVKHQKVVTKHVNTHNAISYVDHNPAEEKELSDKIKSAIALLPPQCQKIFLMSRREGLKYKEIAEKLGLSPKTIEHQMGKALKIMRSELVEYISIFLLLTSTF